MVRLPKRPVESGPRWGPWCLAPGAARSAFLDGRPSLLGREPEPKTLGAPPTMLPNDDEAAGQLTGGGWLYVLRDADRAGRAVVTLLVDDLDERPPRPGSSSARSKPSLAACARPGSRIPTATASRSASRPELTRWSVRACWSAGR